MYKKNVQDEKTRLHFTCQLTLSCFFGRLWLCRLGLNTFLRSVEGIQQSQSVICGYCLRLNSKNWYQPLPSELWGSGCATSRHQTLHHTPSSRTAGLMRSAANIEEHRWWVGQSVIKTMRNARQGFHEPFLSCSTLHFFEGGRHPSSSQDILFTRTLLTQTHTTVVTFNVRACTIWLHANITWSHIER